MDKSGDADRRTNGRPSKCSNFDHVIPQVNILWNVLSNKQMWRIPQIILIAIPNYKELILHTRFQYNLQNQIIYIILKG